MNGCSYETIYINGLNINDYGIKGVRDYKIGGTPISNEYWQGRNRTHFILLSNTFGLKPITFTLVYEGKSRKEAMLIKTKIEAMFFGVVELFMPDGFYYRSLITSISDGVFEGQEDNQILLPVTYQFNGIQHDRLVTTKSGSFLCDGTMPKMDCLLQTTVSQDADTYILGGVTFNDVKVGDVLVVDGLNKRILKNGAPTMISGYFEFPYVVNGENNFTALDNVIVQYYPCYI